LDSLEDFVKQVENAKKKLDDFLEKSGIRYGAISAKIDTNAT